MTRKKTVPIPIKLWNKLANHASEASKKLGREVTVDEYANEALTIVLKDEAIIKECIQKAKEKRKNGTV